MKILLKFVILGAWLLFAAALWQNRPAPATNSAIWSLPSPGILSISRKMTDTHLSARLLPPAQPVDWPNSDLFLHLSIIGN